MKHLLLTSAMLLTMSVQLTHATVHYVKAGATGDGTSWATASGSIDDMLEKAVSGDEIWIATGTYKPVKLINSSKKNSRAFTLKEGVSLYGALPVRKHPRPTEHLLHRVRLTILSMRPSLAEMTMCPTCGNAL